MNQQGSSVVTLPLGFSIEKKEDLTEPYYVHNEVEGREAITREALFAFPLAYAGFLVGGIKGVVAGHIIGAVAGYIRNQRIYAGSES